MKEKSQSEIKKILISHSYRDKGYCDAILQLLRRIGIDEDKIIYTSNSAYGVPLGENIFTFLKNAFKTDLYVLFVFSDDYFESAPTMNEMGAAWVTSSEFLAMTVPGFNYNNDKYRNCVLDHREIAGSLSDISMITQLKNSLVKFFGLDVREDRWVSILSEFKSATESAKKAIKN